MIVDFAGHLYPGVHHPPAVLRNPDAELIGPLLTDPDALCSYIEASPLDRMVLSQPYYMGADDLEATTRANRTLLDTVADHDELYSLAAIPIGAGGEPAAAEFECALDAGSHGGAVEVSPATDGLTDPVYEPVLEVADRTGTPVLVHPKLDESIGSGELDDSYRLNAIFGREIALTDSIWKVVHEELFSSYPNLNLVYHHLGGNIASMTGRIKLQLDSDRWAGEDGLKSFAEFSATVADNIYIDTSGFFGHEQTLETAIELFSAENILFGSDYPYEPRTPAEMATLVESVGSASNGIDSDRILGKNALSLLDQRA